MAATAPLITLEGSSLPIEQHEAAMDTPTFTVEVPVRALALSCITLELTALPSPVAARRFRSLQKANLIHSEILSVTSAMRKNQRWANSSASSAYGASYSPRPGSTTNGRRDQASGPRMVLQGGGARGNDAAGGLMAGFVALKMELREIEGGSPLRRGLAMASLTSNARADTSQLDALTLLHPFLEVVRSPETSGPITATALSSIDRFLTYSILTPSSPSLALAMAQLSTAGTHCKFEASDSVSDEVVLLKILDVLRNSLTGPLGYVLSDESVCEMMETGLSMCCQMRLSGEQPFALILPLHKLIFLFVQRCCVAPLSARCRQWSPPSLLAFEPFPLPLEARSRCTPFPPPSRSATACPRPQRAKMASECRHLIREADMSARRRRAGSSPRDCSRRWIPRSSQEWRIH